jgi:hypothetical protein
VVVQTMWQRTPFTVHSSWFWWSPNGSASEDFFFNLKYLENIYFRTIKVQGRGGEWFYYKWSYGGLMYMFCEWFGSVLLLGFLLIWWWHPRLFV